MKTSRFSRSLVVCFAAFLTLIPVETNIADAATPLQFSIGINQTQTLGICGFPIVRQDVGTLRIQDYFDRDGNFFLEHAIFSDWRIIFSNPANGKSVTSVRAYNEQFVQYDDGSYKAVSAGLVAQLVIPGQGVVAANVGNISVIFDVADEPISILVAGEHDGPIAQFVCPYLE